MRTGRGVVAFVREKIRSRRQDRGVVAGEESSKVHGILVSLVRVILVWVLVEVTGRVHVNLRLSSDGIIAVASQLLVLAYVGVGDDGGERLLQYTGAPAHSFFSRSLRVTACDLIVAASGLGVAASGLGVAATGLMLVRQVVQGANNREHCLRGVRGAGRRDDAVSFLCSSARVIIERGQVLDKVVMVTGFRSFAKVLPMAFGEAATTKHQTNKHHDPHVACTSTGGHGIQHNSCGLVSA